jgi:excisionase family DNA binding protein
MDTTNRQEIVGLVDGPGGARRGHGIQLQAVATLATATASAPGAFEQYFAEIVRRAVREELAAATLTMTAALPPAGAPSEYLTIARAAQIATLHPCTIREWIKDGSLKAYRCGSRGYRILRTDLDGRLTVEAADPTNEHIHERVDAILAKHRSKRRSR